MRRDGGTGRRTGLKIQRGLTPRAGSIPALGTEDQGEISSLQPLNLQCFLHPTQRSEEMICECEILDEIEIVIESDEQMPNTFG